MCMVGDKTVYRYVGIQIHHIHAHTQVTYPYHNYAPFTYTYTHIYTYYCALYPYSPTYTQLQTLYEKTSAQLQAARIEIENYEKTVDMYR